jgi:hypothetical protein
MISEEYFLELVKDLFLEYIPSTKASQRRDFSVALLEELKSNGMDFEVETGDIDKNALFSEE